MRAIAGLLLSLAVVSSLGGQAARPRLLVILVVDQMHADYLTVFRRHWTRGFRRLLADGAVFENAAYPYANTVTCAGHATVATGALPRTHGIVGNTWWNRERGGLVDCSIDTSPDAAHISYGRPAAAGNSAHLFMVPTIGDELRRQHPGARVVSLSLKPDTAVTLAGHGGDVVLWFDGGAGAFVTSKAYAAGPSEDVADFLSTNPLTDELRGNWTLKKPADGVRERGCDTRAAAAGRARRPLPACHRGSGRTRRAIGRLLDAEPGVGSIPWPDGGRHGREASARRRRIARRARHRVFSARPGRACLRSGQP